VKKLLIDTIFEYPANVIAMFGSPLKGLLLFAPPILVSLFAVPDAWRRHREVTIFVWLAVGGLVSGFAFLRFFADEVWGPRYLHSAVAPLLLLIGASRTHFTLRRDGVLIPLVAMGVVISFLGCCFYYGSMHFASIRAGENNEEELQGDPRWNQIWFNARLFSIWWQHPAGAVLWKPDHQWMYDPPPGYPAPQAFDLKEWSQPQSYLITSWSAPHPGMRGVFWVLILLSGIGGPILLIVAARMVRRSRDPVLDAKAAGAPE